MSEVRDLVIDVFRTEITAPDTDPSTLPERLAAALDTVGLPPIGFEDEWRLEPRPAVRGRAVCAWTDWQERTRDQ